jgi:hypothetical protein
MRVLVVSMILAAVAGGTLLAQDRDKMYQVRDKDEILLAQDKDKLNVVNVSFPETIELVAGVSSTYFRVFQERKKSGQLKLSAAESVEMKQAIGRLIEILGKFTGKSKLVKQKLSKDNEAALDLALNCNNCSGTIPEGGKMKNLDDQQQLRDIVLARCSAILGLLPKDNNTEVDTDTIFSLAVHFSYLWLITIAFDPNT